MILGKKFAISKSLILKWLRWQGKMVTLYFDKCKIWICNSFRVLTVHLFIGIKMWFALTLGYVAKWRPNYTTVGAKKIHSFYGFPKEKTYINGKWVTAKDKNVFSVVNPANGENIATVPDCKVSDLDDAIEGSLDAFKTWSNTTGKVKLCFGKLAVDAEKLE